MKLSKAVLGALLVSIALQATSCSKSDAPSPKEEKEGTAPSKPEPCLL
ncbi:chryseobasin-related MNIO class RiPP peptide [Hymenobacter mucosus]